MRGPFSPLVGAFFAATTLLSADEKTETPKIIGEINDGSPREEVPAPVREKPDFEILSTNVTWQRGRRVTLHRVAEPPAEELKKLEPVKPEVTNPKPIPPQVNGGATFMVEAVVYDQQFTKLRFLAPKAGDAEGNDEYIVWSNINWHHLEGFHTFTGLGYRFTFLLLASDGSLTDAEGNVREVVPAGLKPPGESTPSCLVMQGDFENAPPIDFLEGIHELYALNEAKLKQAHALRLENAIKRREELKNNPPQPKDVEIHFWKRETE